MGLAQSRITNQGQVSIPVSIMRQFGFAPGEIIDWNILDGRLVLEKSGEYSLEDIRAALNILDGTHKTEEEIREGVKARMRAKHARR